MVIEVLEDFKLKKFDSIEISGAEVKKRGENILRLKNNKVIIENI